MVPRNLGNVKVKANENRLVMRKSAADASREINTHINRMTKADAPARTIFNCPDVGGLELRINKKSATWALLYNVKVGNKWAKRRLQLGSYPALTVGDARKLAQTYKVDITNGQDPAADRKDLAQQRQQQADEALTVSQLFAEWITSKDMTDRKTGTAEPERMMRKDILPSIGSLDVKNITRRHIAKLQSSLEKRGARITNVTMALTRQMLSFAVNKGYIDELPAFPKKSTENKPCNRVLNVCEIVELFEAIPQSRLTNTTTTALKLQLATACRIGELLIAQWKHVNLSSGEWVIPADNSKTGAELTIYLSSYALNLFRQLYELSGYQRWLFPNRTETGHVDTKAISKQVKDRQRQTQIAGRSSTPDALILSRGTWTPHDLRRSAATLMQGLMVNPYIIERCLNHAADKMARVYVCENPEIEMYKAWEALGELLSLCDSDKGQMLAQLYHDNEQTSLRDRLTLTELIRRIRSNVVPLRAVK